jgi:hypothetical protein
MLKAASPDQVLLQNQQSDIAPNSPMAVVALFTEVVRERFRPGNDLSWVWDVNAVPTDTETNEPDAPHKLFIAPSFGVNNSSRNIRPSIVISKGPTQSQKTVINNVYGQQINTGKKGFWLPCVIPLTFTVTSDQEGESAILADIVWFYLLAAREPIRAEFGIHNYTDPVLGETVPHPDHKDAFQTRITMDITIEFKWFTTPISSKIREVAVRLNGDFGGDLDQLVLQQYVR